MNIEPTSNDPRTNNPTDDSIVNDMVREFVDDLGHIDNESKKRPAKSYIKRSSAPKKERSPRPGHISTVKPAAKTAPEALGSPMLQTANVQAATDYTDDSELPQHYNTSYVRLLPRDPFHIYAYWEISADAVERLRVQLKERFHEACYTLRIYDVTLVDFNGTNANYFFDLDELFMNSRHIRVSNDNANYCAETGVRLWDGTFLAIARSNTMMTQPASQSHRGELMWKEIQVQKQQQAFALIDDQKSKIKQQPRSSKNLQFNLTKIPISGEDIRLFYEKGLTLKSIIQNNLRAGSQQLSGINAEDIELEDIIVTESHFKKTSYKSKFLGASEELVKEFVGASEGMFFRDISKKKQKTFPFEVEMELIVRGKTDPNAKVMLGKEAVKLDPNGAFTLKYVLKDGVIPFDFKATAQDGHAHKKISTSVLRTITERSQNT